MQTAAVASPIGAGGPSPLSSGGLGRLKAEDFFKLLIQQLQFQDPLEPVSNEQLVGQIAQIRDMEMNATLTGVLRTLTGQQQFGMSAALIGKYVEGGVPADGRAGPPVRGVVTAVHYTPGGEQLLQLDTGRRLPLTEVAAVTTLEQVARTIVGLGVRGVVPGPGGQNSPFEGRVQRAEMENGELILTLEGGRRVPFRYVTETLEPEPTPG